MSTSRPKTPQGRPLSVVTKPGSTNNTTARTQPTPEPGVPFHEKTSWQPDKQQSSFTPGRSTDPKMFTFDFSGKASSTKALSAQMNTAISKSSVDKSQPAAFTLSTPISSRPTYAAVTPKNVTADFSFLTATLPSAPKLPPLTASLPANGMNMQFSPKTDILSLGIPTHVSMKASSFNLQSPGSAAFSSLSSSTPQAPTPVTSSKTLIADALFPSTSASQSSDRTFSIDGEWLRRLIVGGCHTVTNYRTLLNQLDTHDGDTGSNLSACCNGIARHMSSIPISTTPMRLSETSALVVKFAAFHSRGQVSLLLLQLFDKLHQCIGTSASMSVSDFYQALCTVGQFVSEQNNSKMAKILLQATSQLSETVQPATASNPTSLLSLMSTLLRAARLVLHQQSESSSSNKINPGAQGLVLLLEGMCDAAAGRENKRNIPPSDANQAYCATSNIGGPHFVEAAFQLNDPTLIASTMVSHFKSLTPRTGNGAGIPYVLITTTGTAKLRMFTESPGEVFTLCAKFAVNNEVPQQRIEQQQLRPNPNQEIQSINKLRIIFESGADLSAPMPSFVQMVSSRLYFRQNVSYRDKVDIQNDEFYELQCSTEPMYESGVPIADWSKSIQTALKSLPSDGEVICICSSQHIVTHSWQSLQQAWATLKESDPFAARQVVCYDSELIGPLLGVLIEKAVEAIQSNSSKLSAAEFCNLLNVIKSRIFGFFVPSLPLQISQYHDLHPTAFSSAPSCCGFWFGRMPTVLLSEGHFNMANTSWSLESACEFGLERLMSQLPAQANLTVCLLHTGRPDLLLAINNAFASRKVKNVRFVCMGASTGVVLGNGAIGVAVIWDPAEPQVAAAPKQPEPVVQKQIDPPAVPAVPTVPAAPAVSIAPVEVSKAQVVVANTTSTPTVTQSTPVTATPVAVQTPIKQDMNVAAASTSAPVKELVISTTSTSDAVITPAAAPSSTEQLSVNPQTTTQTSPEPAAPVKTLRERLSELPLHPDYAVQNADTNVSAPTSAAPAPVVPAPVVPAPAPAPVQPAPSSSFMCCGSDDVVVPAKPAQPSVPAASAQSTQPPADSQAVAQPAATSVQTNETNNVAESNHSTDPAHHTRFSQEAVDQDDRKLANAAHADEGKLPVEGERKTRFDETTVKEQAVTDSLKRRSTVGAGALLKHALQNDEESDEDAKQPVPKTRFAEGSDNQLTVTDSLKRRSTIGAGALLKQGLQIDDEDDEDEQQPVTKTRFAEGSVKEHVMSDPLKRRSTIGAGALLKQGLIDDMDDDEDEHRTAEINLDNELPERRQSLLRKATGGDLKLRLGLPTQLSGDLLAESSSALSLREATLGATEAIMTQSSDTEWSEIRQNSKPSFPTPPAGMFQRENSVLDSTATDPTAAGTTTQPRLPKHDTDPLYEDESPAPKATQAVSVPADGSAAAAPPKEKDSGCVIA